MDNDKEAKLREKLFNCKSRSEGADEMYLEQYKLYVESIDKISDRRQHANSYFLSLNTGICVILGYLFSKDADPIVKSVFWVLPVAGVLLSFFWKALVKSYSQLNTGKFSILHKIEERLPLSPYQAEWLALGEGKDKSKYQPITHIEVWIPIIFISMYSFIFLYMLPWKKMGSFIRSLLFC